MKMMQYILVQSPKPAPSRSRYRWATNQTDGTATVRERAGHPAVIERLQYRRGAGAGPATGSVNSAVLLLIVAVTLSSCCLLWFMNQAVQSERLAVRQRLIDTYRQSCDSLIEKSNSDWQQNIEHIKTLADSSQQELISLLLGGIENGRPVQGFASGLVLYDSDGKIIWPTENISGETTQIDETIFNTAYHLEFEQKDYTSAIKEYAGITVLSDNPEIKKLSLIGQARCLQQQGLIEKAIEMCKQAITISEENNIEPKIFMTRLLVLSGSEQAKDHLDELLIQGLSNDNQLTISQRTLLLKEAIGMIGENFHYNLLTAAKNFLVALEISPSLAQKKDVSKLVENSVIPIDSNLWGLKLTSEKGNTIVLVFDKYKIAAQTIVRKYMEDLPPDIFCKLYDNNGKYITFGLKNTIEDGSAIYSISEDTGVKLFEIRNPLKISGWQIDAFLWNDNIFNAAAKQRTALYFYLGFITIVTFAVLGIGVIVIINRQVRTNKLKNNFIATVTHELKTPLASTRMLIDTILEGRVKDAQAQTEYLEIISRENIRLTRLIDNFLAFSRMERNRNAFNIRPVCPARIARRAAEAMSTKIETERGQLVLDITGDLPQIEADFDAMVTVLTNLLDNACKYSKDDNKQQKLIKLKVYRDGQNVCFEIRDNGIGMTPKQTKKIFERFYQADQRLSRKVEGCGLGLSIVKFILDAHGAAIEVKSKPDEGSCFTIRF